MTKTLNTTEKYAAELAQVIAKCEADVKDLVSKVKAARDLLSIHENRDKFGTTSAEVKRLHKTWAELEKKLNDRQKDLLFWNRQAERIAH